MKPWLLYKPISIKGVTLPPLFLVQNGWKEDQHTLITQAKDKIAEFENKEEWEIRKKITNPYEPVFSGTDNTFPSLAVVQPLSRSYFKMIEMLQMIDFWGSTTLPLKTAHICEGPGGFIQCVVEESEKRRIDVESLDYITNDVSLSKLRKFKR